MFGKTNRKRYKLRNVYDFLRYYLFCCGQTCFSLEENCVIGIANKNSEFDDYFKVCLRLAGEGAKTLTTIVNEEKIYFASS